MRLYKEFFGYHKEGRWITTKIFFEYRKDPVPGIHRYKHRIGCWYRQIENMGEKRRWFADQETLKEHGFKVRYSRSPRTLPDAWDDYPKAKNYDRGWKRSKKRKQWM